MLKVILAIGFGLAVTIAQYVPALASVNWN